MSNHLFDRIAATLDRYADAIALQTPAGQTWRFADLDRCSAQMAEALLAAGLQPGDRLSAQVGKSPQALCLYLACVRAGVVFHPLNPDYRAQELQYFLSNAAPAAVVCTDAAADTLRTLIAPEQLLFTLDSDGSGSLTDAAHTQPGEFRSNPRSPDDTAALLYSSGTTGTPKGIPLTHGNLASNAETLVSHWEFSAADTLLHVLPIFHVHGLFVACHCALFSGAAMRWLASFDGDSVLQQLQHCTVMMGVPTHYTRLLQDKRFDAAHCQRIRVFISGSAPLRPETFDAFEQRSGQRILERYGMTETGMLTSNPLHGERRAGTVGTALPGVELRITSAEGHTAAVGDTGAIEVRGPNVFRGYWQLPEKTAEDFTDDGFFRTGDQGFLNAAGYLTIAGRSKDLIITGGLNVYPREVELVLDQFDGVEESAVIGIPHPDFGEAVVAVVVPGPTPPDTTALLQQLRTQLAPFKLPKHIVLATDLPRNAMGKVQKATLRAQFRDLFEA